jgi:hypothetical protein
MLMAIVHKFEQTFSELKVDFLRQSFLRSGFFVIKPSVASYILENYNSKNRKISQTKISQTCSDIAAGRFLVNGESVIFDSNGMLIDGQHRLFACVSSNVEIVSLCAFGIDPEAMRTIDLGKGRTVGDIAQIEGVPNGNSVAAIARILLAYEHNKGETFGRPSDLSSNQVIDYIKQNSDIIEIDRWASTFQTALRGISSRTVFAAARIILERRYGPIIIEYLEQLGSGANIGPSDAAFVIRRRLFGARKTNALIMEAILKGAVHFVKGRTVSRIEITGRFPVLT